MIEVVDRAHSFRNYSQLYHFICVTCEKCEDWNKFKGMSSFPLGAARESEARLMRRKSLNTQVTFLSVSTSHIFFMTPSDRGEICFLNDDKIFKLYWWMWLHFIIMLHSSIHRSRPYLGHTGGFENLEIFDSVSGIDAFWIKYWKITEGAAYTHQKEHYKVTLKEIWASRLASKSF